MSRVIGWTLVGVLAAAVLVAVPNGSPGGAGGAGPGAAVTDTDARLSAAVPNEVAATSAPAAALLAQKARRPESSVPGRRPTSTARPLMDSVRPPVPWPCRPLGAITALSAAGAVPRVAMLVRCLHGRGFA
jgi:hypothetical protein